MTLSRPVIAIGPKYPEIGSWEWVGEGMAAELSKYYEINVFSDLISPADVVIIVKYDLSRLISSVPDGMPVIYCPIDCYGSSADIDRDGQALFRCQKILIHAEPLRKYFSPYAPVEYMDHHIRFAPESTDNSTTDGPILWTGIRSNLPPLVEWVNQHPLPCPLWILTNLENQNSTTTPEEFGFSDSHPIKIENWSEEKHLKWAAEASVAIDIKGDNFRARHKPPAKALDSLAAGLPLAMNADSSSVQHLAHLGFDVATPENIDAWFSPDYLAETRKFGAALRELLSRERIGRRFKRVIDSLLPENRKQKQQQTNLIKLSQKLNDTINHSNEVSPEVSSSEVTSELPLQKIAILSFLFNYPSTGGGNIHTVELVQFLRKAGYQVEHFCPQFDPWEIGQIEPGSPLETNILQFQPNEWQPANIRSRFQNAVDQFNPDCVIITDSWNFKPHLAAAVRKYPYFLRMQALECLCPLNNLQLLPVRDGLTLCPHNQLTHPKTCVACLTKNQSGALHTVERQLSGVGTTEYQALLQQSIKET